MVINELNEYISAIHEMRYKNIELEAQQEENQYYFFRGQANSNWDVYPSVFRNDLITIESDLIKTAYLRNPKEFKAFGSNFECLSKLQHYGLPTRLLDVTMNPLIALYFACQKHEEIIEDEDSGKKFLEATDGVVFYKQAYGNNYQESNIEMLAYLASHAKGDMTLEKLLSNLEIQEIYTKSEASLCRNNKYRSLIEGLQKNYFVVPSFNNDRLIRQSGAFLITGQYNIIIDKENIGNSIIQRARGNLNKEFEEEKFIIPVENKEKILEELDFYNVNEAALFPELEHQMLYIKVKQSNKSVTSVGNFSVINETILEENELQKDFKSLTDEESKKIFKSSVNYLNDKNLQKICYDSLVKNLIIDWYKKESTISAMKVDLTRVLAKTFYFDKVSAKKEAEKIINNILLKIFNDKR